MATRNIVLTDHQSQVVDHLVASGRYQNASEVLRAGLRMVEEAESRYITKMNDLKAAIDAGKEDLEAGRTRAFTGDDLLPTFLNVRSKPSGNKSVPVLQTCIRQTAASSIRSRLYPQKLWITVLETSG